MDVFVKKYRPSLWAQIVRERQAEAEAAANAESESEDEIEDDERKERKSRGPRFGMPYCMMTFVINLSHAEGRTNQECRRWPLKKLSQHSLRVSHR